MTTSRTADAIRLVRSAIESGAILHAVDTDGCPITAGRMAVPGDAPRWSVLRYPPPGYGRGGEPQEDDCGTPAACARVLVRTYLGAVRASESVERLAP
jgi:hypothetical protein